MRKPNVIFLSVIAVVALLPHTSRWLDSSEKPDTSVTSSTTPRVQPAIAPAQPTSEAGAAATVSDAAVPVAVPVDETGVSADDGVEETHPWHVLPITEPTSAKEPLAALEEIYLTEGFDAEWAAPLEEDFYRTFETANLADSAVEQAECRSTLCRFAISHKDIQAQNAFIQAFLESPLLPLINQGAIAHHSQPAADGSLTAIYFLARNELAQLHH